MLLMSFFDDFSHIFERYGLNLLIDDGIAVKTDNLSFLLTFILKPGEDVKSIGRSDLYSGNVEAFSVISIVEPLFLVDNLVISMVLSFYGRG